MKKSNSLENRKIAILAVDGFSESQLFSSKKALEEAGAKVFIVSLKKGNIKAWNNDHWGKSIVVDETVNNTSSDEFDALVIPGSSTNPDLLYHNKDAINFVKNFIHDGKSIASICHGTQLLIKTGLARGRTLTTWPSLKKDLINSGAKWKDDEIVVNKGIITSRCPYENPIFNKKMIEGFSISPRSKRSMEG